EVDERGSSRLRRVSWDERAPVRATRPHLDSVTSIPGQGVEPRSPRSERGVLPARRSRSTRGTQRPVAKRDTSHRTPPLHPPPERGRSTQQANGVRRVQTSRVLCHVRTRRTMFSMPLAYPSTLDRRPPVAQRALRWTPSYVEELWSPGLDRCVEKSML